MVWFILIGLLALGFFIYTIAKTEMNIDICDEECVPGHCKCDGDCKSEDCCKSKTPLPSGNGHSANGNHLPVTSDNVIQIPEAYFEKPVPEVKLEPKAEDKKSPKKGKSKKGKKPKK